MRIEGLRYRDEWLPNFYPSREVAGQHFRASRTGRFILLGDEENARLDDIDMPQELFERLERTGHIVTSANAGRVMEDLKTWFQKTYAGPELHIVVTTKRCNLDCAYCHMIPEAANAPRSRFDLDRETAEAIVRFILSTPNSRCTIEFQGGEPFLNFDGLRHVVETAKAQNRSVGKQLEFTVVSNLIAVTDEHLAFCAEHGVSISYTLSGPREVHDLHRRNRAGKGSFDTVMSKIEQINSAYPGLLSASPLCVVDSEVAGRLIEILDFFHDAGFDSVAILRLRRLGKARGQGIPFDIHAFLRHYLGALDYLFDKSRRTGRTYSERMIRVAIAKLISDADVGFVDWRNPCGDFGSTLTYDYDGEILPSDEARSLRERFGLGNVANTTYADLASQAKSHETMTLSLRDRHPVCRECAFNPFCGVSPILDYARSGDAEPRPHESDECLFTIAALDWTLGKYMEDPVTLIAMLPGAGVWAEEVLANPAATRRSVAVAAD